MSEGSEITRHPSAHTRIQRIRNLANLADKSLSVWRGKHAPGLPSPVSEIHEADPPTPGRLSELLQVEREGILAPDSQGDLIKARSDFAKEAPPADDRK